MHRKVVTAREERNRVIQKFDHLSKILQSSKAMQTRFVLIPDKALNATVVAGVRDMNLARPNVGANVVRFNNPSPKTKSNYHRICIDPKGRANKANPHIPVSPGTVKAAEAIQKGLQVTGKALLVVSIVASGVRIAKAIYDEVGIDKEIEAMENIVDCLQEDLRNCDTAERTEIQDALEFAQSLLEDARHCKLNPGKKTVLTSLCIGGEWCGAAAMGFAGAQGGAAIGAVGGPLGAIAGAITGSVVGAVAGSELGASAVENFRCDEDGIATEMQGSVVDFGSKRHGQVLGIDGNVFLGKGVEVGARAALFRMAEKNESFTVGKAGANLGITNKGVDVGVESKLVWAEAETEKSKVGFGLNLDTGFQANKNGVGLSVLGFGFSAEDSGFSFKLPFVNFKVKSK